MVSVRSSVCLRWRAGGGGRGAFGSRCVTLLPSVCADGAVSSVTAGSQKSRENKQKKLRREAAAATLPPNQSQGHEPENTTAKKRSGNQRLTRAMQHLTSVLVAFVQQN